MTAHSIFNFLQSFSQHCREGVRLTDVSSLRSSAPQLLTVSVFIQGGRVHISLWDLFIIGVVWPAEGRRRKGDLVYQWSPPGKPHSQWLMDESIVKRTGYIKRQGTRKHAERGSFHKLRFINLDIHLFFCSCCQRSHYDSTAELLDVFDCFITDSGHEPCFEKVAGFFLNISSCFA